MSEIQAGDPGEPVQPHKAEPATSGTTESNPWFRLPYLVMFLIVFKLVGAVVGLTALVQFILRVVMGRPNERLQQVGIASGWYLRQLVHFLTYATDTVPYPFSPWPKA